MLVFKIFVVIVHVSVAMGPPLLGLANVHARKIGRCGQLELFREEHIGKK
jgi:hypothetical protein